MLDSKETLSIIAKRFIRGFVASFVSVASTVAIGNPATFTDLYTALNVLVLAGIVAGITGGFLALDKYFRLEE